MEKGTLKVCLVYHMRITHSVSMATYLVIGNGEIDHCVPVHPSLQHIGTGGYCIQDQLQCKPSKYRL